MKWLIELSKDPNPCLFFVFISKHIYGLTLSLPVTCISVYASTFILHNDTLVVKGLSAVSLTTGQSLDMPMLKQVQTNFRACVNGTFAS